MTTAKQKLKIGRKSYLESQKCPKWRRGKLKELLKCIKVNGFWPHLSDNKRMLSSIDATKHWQGQVRDKPLMEQELVLDLALPEAKQEAKERVNKLAAAKKRKKT